MIKRIFTLMGTSILVSAGLLYLGITMMGQVSPARASSLDALVAETTAQNSTDPVPAVDGNSLPKNMNSTIKEVEIPSTPTVVASSPFISSQAQTGPATPASGFADANGTTIAELLKNPKQFDDVVITINGIATVLNNEKFLLNDGTGQILVEVEDEKISLAVLNGLSVTVMGELDDTSSANGIEVDACSLQYLNESIVFDDCIDDDVDDDINDDDDINEDDDINDDDDCSNDDCSDDADCINDDCSDDDSSDDDSEDDDSSDDDSSDDDSEDDDSSDDEGDDD